MKLKLENFKLSKSLARQISNSETLAAACSISLLLFFKNFCFFFCCLFSCVLCCAVLCCAVLCCVVLCCVVLCCVVLCCVVLCCVVLCCVVCVFADAPFQKWAVFKMHRNSKMSSFNQDATTFKNEQFQDATELFPRGFSRCNKSENEQLQKPLFCTLFVVGWLVVGGVLFLSKYIQPLPKWRRRTTREEGGECSPTQKGRERQSEVVLHCRVVLLGLLLLSVVLPSSSCEWCCCLPSFEGLPFCFFFEYVF